MFPFWKHSTISKEKELSALEEDNKDLRLQLRDKSLRSKPGFMTEVTKLGGTKS